MKSLNFIKVSACLLSLGTLVFATSCEDNSKNEENASIVNVEKGVASPLWTPESEGNPIEMTPEIKVEEEVAADSAVSETEEVKTEAVKTEGSRKKQRAEQSNTDTREEKAE